MSLVILINLFCFIEKLCEGPKIASEGSEIASEELETASEGPETSSEKPETASEGPGKKIKTFAEHVATCPTLINNFQNNGTQINTC